MQMRLACTVPGRDDRLSRPQCVVHGVPAADRTTPRPGLREGGIAKAGPQDGENAVVVRGTYACSQPLPLACRIAAAAASNRTGRWELPCCPATAATLSR